MYVINSTWYSIHGAGARQSCDAHLRHDDAHLVWRAVRSTSAPSSQYTNLRVYICLWWKIGDGDALQPR